MVSKLKYISIILLIVIFIYFQTLPYAFTEKHEFLIRDVATPVILLTSFYSRKLYHVHIECDDNGTIRLFGSSWRKFVQDNLSVEVCVLHFIQEDVTRFYVTGYKKKWT